MKRPWLPVAALRNDHAINAAIAIPRPIVLVEKNSLTMIAPLMIVRSNYEAIAFQDFAVTSRNGFVAS